MQLHTFPRAYLGAALATTRLPLTLAERLTNHADDRNWPPTVAFDAFDANVRLIVGSLLRDEQLVEQGRRTQARISEQREAMHLSVVAEETKREADQTFAVRRAADEQKREAARARAEQRASDAEGRRREAKAKADTLARERAAQARRVEADRAQALDKKERATKAAAIKKERAAIASAKRAAAAKKAAAATDKQIRASKASRRSA